MPRKRGKPSRAYWDRNLHYLDALLDDGFRMLENAGVEPDDKGDPASKLMSVNDRLRHAEGVSPVRTFQTPLLVTARRPGSHRRGPPRGKNKAKGHKESHEPPEYMRQMLKEMQQAGGQEIKGEPVQKEAFPRGSSASVPASAAGREAMPGTGTGDWDRDLHHLETLVNHGLRILELGEAELDEDDAVDEDDLDSQPIPITEPLGDAEGVSAGRTFPGPLVDVARRPSLHRRGPPRRKKKPIGAIKSLEDSKHLEQKRSDVDSQRDAADPTAHNDNIWESMRRVFCWGTACLIKLMAIVAGVALCLMMCCAGIWYCWKTKRSASPSPEDQPNKAGSENLSCDLTYPLLPLSALPWLQHCRHEAVPKPTTPQWDPLPLSPLVLFPSQD
ncbi:uncharacterized protein LOC135280390 [Passer domesticus]|uniref:uncharacterized protein LOC135280390 n=1 Tax=Passer domesticus TaxID=48849 RepID=UPI0030FF3642